MIRINLLSVREVRRRVELRHQLRVASVLGCVALALAVWLSWSQAQVREARTRELQQIEAELKSLEKILAEVKQFEQQSELLQRKIEAINAIKTNQRQPALFLDAISESLPGQVWLVAVQEAGASLRISGRSLNGNPGVADFMKNIERSPLFGTAGLIESKSETLQDRQVMSFTITVPMIFPKKTQTTS